ncbi:MAG: ABC transporter permease, partial [Candidatus Acidiferrales bacterium]
MKLLSSLRFRIATLFHRSQANIEMDEELRSHIQHRADALERSGLPRAKAERRARIEFGGYQKVKEECRETFGVHFVETLVQDVRYAIRTLRNSLSFTAAAVLTLAVAIGANAVVFAALNALVLRPLNVLHPQTLYTLEWASDKYGADSYPNYLDIRDRNRSFDFLAAFTMSETALQTGQNTSLVWAYEVTGNYFDALGIHPYLGRLIHASDEHGDNSAPYVVLSYAYWHSHFQDDRSVVGRTVEFNDHPFTIIGVVPPTFHGTLVFFSPDLFAPVVNQSQIEGTRYLNVRGGRWLFEMLGHLKPGVTAAQATADVNSIASYLQKTYPKDDDQRAYLLARPSLGGDFLGTAIRAFLAALMLLAGLILLAACANLGSLFAARAADRSREVALRLALGASRLRILRHLFTEAILISLIGGAAGLWGSVLLLRQLSVWRPFPEFPMNLAVNPDGHVYVFALLLA